MREGSVLQTVTCAAMCLLCGGCESNDRSRGPAQPAAGAAAAVSDEHANRPRVLVLGDSLTAGLGLDPSQAYPAILQQRIDAAGLGYEVVNAGVSGDTSAGGLSRLDWSLAEDVRVVIVALGANDGLRGLPVEELRRNLDAIITRAQAKKAAVILAGMEAPPNFGRAYTDAFHEVYPALAKSHGIAFVPFLLQGVAGIEKLNQPDGIHPTAEGARIAADNVWQVLEPVLKTHGPKGRASN